MGQMGFFDLSNRYTELDAKNDPLAKIDEVVPGEDFRGCLDAVWRRSDRLRKSRTGRKPWDAVVMFKTIILSARYNLSDDQVEHQIRDRLSFMRPDLAAGRVNRDMQLAPRAPRFTVLGASPLTSAKEFQARGIQHDIRRPFVRAGFHNDIHRLPPPRQRGVIRHRQIAPHQVHEGTHKAFRMAQRQSEDHPQHQCRGNRQL